VGAPDPSLTATSRVAAIAEFLTKLDVVATFDRGIGSIKKRARGATAGELLLRHFTPPLSRARMVLPHTVRAVPPQR